jgi:hypothetical protein
VAADFGVALVVPFGLLATRSLLVRDPRLRPGGIGMVELGCFVVLVVAAALS